MTTSFLLAAWILTADPKGEDWPGFLGPHGDNTSLEAFKPWPKEGPKKLWECKLGESYGPPSVSDGKLYHFDIADRKAVLTCRDATNGKQLWTYDYPCNYQDAYGYDGTRCCPVIDGDRVYTYGPDGTLHCVKDGKKIWAVDTVRQFHVLPNFFGVGSTPVIERDLLIVAVGGSPKGQFSATPLDAKPDKSCIVAFDKHTGNVKYTTGDELSSYTSPVVRTIGEKRIGLYYARGGLLAFDATTGASLAHFAWRAKMLESAIAANPVIVGDRILISESYELGTALLQFKNNSFETLWTDRKRDRDEKALLAHWCTPIYHDGFIYSCSSRHSSEADLRGVNFKTGEVMWIEKKTRWCTLVKVDGHLLSLHETGELRLIKLNSTKYEEIARWESPDLSHPCWAPPVIAQGRLFLRGKEKLVCYEVAR